jgi:hypothetical protein
MQIQLAPDQGAPKDFTRQGPPQKSPKPPLAPGPRKKRQSIFEPARTMI